MKFGTTARRQQEHFRDTSPTISPEGRNPSDKKGERNRYLLAVGQEMDNLYPSLRGVGGAMEFFAARGIKWWQSTRSGDNTGIKAPTRNMASSQIACVNCLLPLVEAPEALVAILRVLDDDVEAVMPIEYVPRGAAATVSSPVEFEWVGLESCLEGGVGTRGANSTSVDALMVGVTAKGVKRAYLCEWKYVEEYRNAEFLGDGKSGDTRRRRYADLYARQDSRFRQDVPLDELLYEPIYQIMRLGLLADRMVRDGELGVQEARVVVVCPEQNIDYRETITSPGLGAQFPEAGTVEEMMETACRDPKGFKMTSSEALVEAVRGCSVADGVSDWLEYHHERYGW